MGAIARVRVPIQGWQGGAGLMTFYGLAEGEAGASIEAATNFANDIRAMLDDLRTYVISGWSAIVDPVIDEFDIETGALVNVLSVPAIAPVLGGGLATNVSRATQAKFQYRSDAIVGNRLLRGGPFFGPLAGGSITQQGQVQQAMLAAVPVAHNRLLDINVAVDSLRLALWSRPRPAEAGQPARPGRHGYVQSAGCSGIPAVLRSRRD